MILNLLLALLVDKPNIIRKYILLILFRLFSLVIEQCGLMVHCSKINFSIMINQGDFFEITMPSTKKSRILQ